MCLIFDVLFLGQTTEDDEIIILGTCGNNRNKTVWCKTILFYRNSHRMPQGKDFTDTVC